MYYLDEPLVHDKAQSRRERKSLYTGMIAGLSIAAVVGFAAQQCTHALAKEHRHVEQ